MAGSAIGPKRNSDDASSATSMSIEKQHNARSSHCFFGMVIRLKNNFCCREILRSLLCLIRVECFIGFPFFVLGAEAWNNQIHSHQLSQPKLKPSYSCEEDVLSNQNSKKEPFAWRNNFFNCCCCSWINKEPSLPLSSYTNNSDREQPVFVSLRLPSACSPVSSCWLWVITTTTTGSVEFSSVQWRKKKKR